MDPAKAIMQFYADRPGYIKKAMVKKYPVLGPHADDIEQETYIRALERAGSLRDDANIAGWLFIIARNVSVDYIRRSTKRNEIIRNHREDLTIKDESIDSVVEQERMRLLNDAAESLPKSLKAVYLLVADGKSHAEVAEELNIDINALRQRYHRMKCALMERVYAM
ncbi:MAG: sigma-70 family RNA polymerase sigma factor [Candidatus Woesearchaeota archaeon]